MKFNYEIIISDIENLIFHVNECIDNRDGNSRSFIESSYEQIISHTPFEWYFCSGLPSCGTDLATYESIKATLEMLRGRIEIALTHRVFSLEALFDEIRPKIIEEIINATIRIDVAVAWLSDREILEAIEKKAKEGVVVRIILYKTPPNDNAVLRLKAVSNITLYSVPNFGATGQNLMHNKFAVFDNEKVITGSYNWSSNANGNIENVVIIVNTELARSFTTKFATLIEQFSQYREV